jgi:hypothetical protein
VTAALDARLTKAKPLLRRCVRLPDGLDEVFIDRERRVDETEALLAVHANEQRSSAAAATWAEMRPSH